MNVIAMITARSTSSRFPRKHLANLGGKPMIVQIIKKLKRLQQLDSIVLATTDNEADDELSDVAMSVGATVIRGSETDLVQRHTEVLHKTGADYVLDVSGDCPFQDVRAQQLLIDAMLQNPGYDNYAISGPYAALPEMLGAGHSFYMYYKMFKLFEANKENYSAEQYWIVAKQYPGAFSTYIVDGTHLMEVSVTPMKLSIDWNLERMMWNKIIKHLGYYPEKIEDINKAFREIKKL